MGINERRERERERRRRDILLAAWEVAEELGWSRFSMEQVAVRAELGRATLYGYFESLDALVVALAEEALEAFSGKLARAPALSELLDVPVRFAQANPPAYELLFPAAAGGKGPSSAPALTEIRAKAQRLIRRMQRVSSNSAPLDQGDKSGEAFLAAIAMAATVVPELRTSTTLRHRWQEFCLKSLARDDEPPETTAQKDDVELAED